MIFEHPQDYEELNSNQRQHEVIGHNLLFSDLFIRFMLWSPMAYSTEIGFYALLKILYSYHLESMAFKS